MPDALARLEEPPEAFLTHLGAEGLLADVRPLAASASWLAERGLVAAVEGMLALTDRAVPVQVALPVDFPRTLPVIGIDPRGELAGLPHVGPDGAVCYDDRDEPLLDHRNPRGIVSEALGLAAGTLNRSLQGDRATEYANEIVAYWRANFPGAPRVVSVLDPSDTARRVTAFFRQGERITLADDPATLASFRDGRNVKHLSFVNAVYVPIDPAAIAPGFHPRDLATPDGVRTFVIPVLKQDKDFWRKVLGRCRSEEVVVALGVRRPTGRRGLVGLLLKRGKDAHPLDPDRLEAWRITPLRMEPADAGFLLPRGGADLDLAKRRVLVLGCGSVGGYVAFNLVKAGVGELHLLDRERFEYANTFRHVCGRAHVRGMKVEGLKLEIERLWPFVKVVPHTADVLGWMREHPAGFRDYDLVISAIGNPTIEQQVNEVIHADASAPPVMFAWLEPLGLGGHVLLAHVGAASRGCFECLYHHAGEEGALACRTAFATPGGRYTRDTMGCGSQHMAFADLDAQKTAAYVARRAVDLLRGTATEGELISWKGDADAFRAAGFTTTPRYDQGPAEEALPGGAIVRPDCPVCRTP